MRAVVFEAGKEPATAVRTKPGRHTPGPLPGALGLERTELGRAQADGFMRTGAPGVWACSGVTTVVQAAQAAASGGDAEGDLTDYGDRRIVLRPSQ